MGPYNIHGVDGFGTRGDLIDSFFFHIGHELGLQEFYVIISVVKRYFANG